MEIKIDKFYTIIQELNKFNKFLDSIHQKCSKSFEYGYLIEKTILDNLKIKTSYEKLKNFENKGEFLQELHKIYKDAEGISIQGCEPKIFKNHQEMIETLEMGYEYYIINISIWKNLNNVNLDDNEGKIKFQIDSENLILL